jgi:cell division protein ZapE
MALQYNARGIMSVTLIFPRILQPLNSMTKTIMEQYEALVASGEIEADAAQAAAVQRFAVLSDALAGWKGAQNGGLFGWMRSGKKSAAPKGIYLHGAVGRGKTMLMDLFFDTVRVERKRRVHFHAFMADVHERIGIARKTVEGDPIPHVATGIAKQVSLLCFDELHVTDIADAMILGRLFKGLFEADVVVVATSNAHPSELYKNGLNRQLFVPFIQLLEAKMDEIELDVQKDFRLEKLVGEQLYFTPNDASARAALDRLWGALTGSAGGSATVLEVKGRKVDVPVSAMGAARFDFDDLCAKPLGSNDYLAIARAYHTVFIDNIPILTPAKRNEARRFINLIDTLYDQKVGLVASAAAEPDAIYPKGDGADLFQRTASRLIEMRSQAYLESREERVDLAGQKESDGAAAAAQ